MRQRAVRLVCLGLGIGLLGYTLSGLFRNRVFLLGAAQADGVIVALRDARDGATAPVIRFSTEGGSVVDWTGPRQGMGDGARVGDHLHVLYMPETPSVAVIGSALGLYGRFAASGLAGLVLVAFGRREIARPRRSVLIPR